MVTGRKFIKGSNTDTLALEHKIGEIVYDLCGLTPKEIIEVKSAIVHVDRKEIVHYLRLKEIEQNYL
ncbi:MAG: hypothetical protein ACOYU0_00680 [Nitrospirota bacterium]